mmetsp:Transcript_10157/g.24192  ORF Transcript_10157/g.24192 Transcript_10157/m.24192 type:complete len:113 (-) Transcript_10157:902-1240(-)
MQLAEVLHPMCSSDLSPSLRKQNPLPERLPATPVYMELPQPQGVRKTGMSSGLREALGLRPELRTAATFTCVDCREEFQCRSCSLGHIRVVTMCCEVWHQRQDAEGAMLYWS